MMKNNKSKIIFTSFIVMLPAIMGLILWDKLPDTMTTHWNAKGEADGWSGKAFSVFGLPLIMLGTHLFCIWITSKDKKNREQSNKVIGMLLWIAPMVSLITCGMVYAVAFGNGAIVDVVVRVLLGVMFVVIGNYLPKCKQNRTIGVKVSWTLRNEENWNKTHRFTGRLWVLGGLLILATLWIPMENIMYGFVAIILIMSFVPVLYSYLYYRKQIKAGTATKESVAATPKEKKSVIIAVAISAVVLVLVGILLLSGEVRVQYGEDTFTVEMTYWNDSTVSYAEIEEIEYREKDYAGERTYGFGSFKLLAGKFHNEEFGDYTRYSYINCDACVVIKSADKVLVINGKDEASTKTIYDELNKRMYK